MSLLDQIRQEIVKETLEDFETFLYDRANHEVYGKMFPLDIFDAREFIAAYAAREGVRLWEKP